MSLTTTRTRYRTENVGNVFISVNSISVSFWLEDKVLLKSDLTVHADLSSSWREFLSRVCGTRVIPDISTLRHHLNK